MDSSELKQIQAPLKERYKLDPSAAFVTLKAIGKPGLGITCSIESRGAIAKAGLHPMTGGDGLALCSGDMLLESLAACAGVTLNAVANAIDFKFSDASVIVEGDLDFRGTLGVAKEVPVGFVSIRLRFDIETAETSDRLQTLLKLTERYCVVYQTLQKANTIQTYSNS
jgi:uncharacterized OsmC-like protein